MFPTSLYFFRCENSSLNRSTKSLRLSELRLKYCDIFAVENMFIVYCINTILEFANTNIN